MATSEAVFLSWPFTPYEITVPMRMPTAKVSRIERVYVRRFAFKRTQRALTRGFINDLRDYWGTPIIPSRQRRGPTRKANNPGPAGDTRFGYPESDATVPAAILHAASRARRAGAGRQNLASAW